MWDWTYMYGLKNWYKINICDDVDNRVWWCILEWELEWEWECDIW